MNNAILELCKAPINASKDNKMFDQKCFYFYFFVYLFILVFLELFPPTSTISMICFLAESSSSVLLCYALMKNIIHLTARKDTHTHNVVVITRRWEYTFLSFVSSVTTLNTENLLRISV